MSSETKSEAKLWTPGRIIATAIVGLGVATLGFVMLSGRFSTETEARLGLPGTQATEHMKVPPDFEIRTIDGRTVKLSDYRGKVLVVDFWATWCPPCRKEIPQLARIVREKAGRGVEIIGLHIDDRGRSTPDAIREFIDRYGINYTVGFATDEMFTAYLGTEDDRIPQTLVFGRDGKLIEHLISYSDQDAKRLDEAVNRAVAERARAFHPNPKSLVSRLHRRIDRSVRGIARRIALR